MSPLTDSAVEIIWVNPVGSAAFDAEARLIIERVRSTAHTPRICHLESGPPHLEYHLYEGDAFPRMLTLMREAEKDGCGAGIIGCFYDGGIRELRNSLRMPVVGMEEATVLLAATLGHRFSIIVGRRKWIPKMHDNVIRYGVESRLASFRSVEMGIPEIYANPTEFDSRVIEASLKATSEDGADVIILSELVPSSLEARAKDELPVALVDPGAVCWKWAEMAADLYLKLGLTHSHP